jgi:exopolysaccharide production protein ExoZ
LLSPYNVLFLLGIAVAWIVGRGPLPHARLLAGAGTLVFLTIGLVENAKVFAPLSTHGLIQVLLYGTSSMLIIAGLAAGKRTGTPAAGDTAAGRAARTLGSLSYPLYLTHGMVISIVVTLAGRLPVHAPGWLVLLAGVTLACGVAMLVHRWIEQPLARRLKRLEDRRRGPAPVASAP